MLIGEVRRTGCPLNLAFKNFDFGTLYLEMEAEIEENLLTLPGRLNLT